MNDSQLGASPASDAEGEARALDIRRYVDILLKRKWIIAATVALVVTATVLHTLRQTPLYRASATVVIDPLAPQVLGREVDEVVQLGAGDYWANQEYYNTQVEVLTSRKLARITASRPEVYGNAKIVPVRDDDTRTTDDKIEEAAGVILGAVSAAVSEESRIGRIYMTHPNPEVARDLANAHLKAYVRYNVGLRATGSEDSSLFLAAEKDAAERDLRDSETKLYEFKQTKDILSVSLEDRQSIVADNIKRYTEAVGSARAERIQQGTLRDRVLSVATLDLVESPLFALGKSEGGVNLKNQYLQEQQKLIQMREELGPKWPDVLQQQKKLNELRLALDTEKKVVLREVEERYAAALASEQSFTRELERYKKEAIDLGPLEVEYKRLLRKQKSDEERYNIVLSRLRAADLSGRQTSEALGNIHELDEARKPAAPIYPRMELNVVLAMALSLVLGVVLAFLVEYLDRTLKSAEQVEQAVGAAVLGIIPVVDEISGEATPAMLRERDLFVFKNPTSRAAECCRSIRTNILFTSADKPLNTVTISSPNPREGKTTTCIYLGTTMAQSGQRVLLVDSDMRRPRLHQALGVSRTRGLSNLILGDVDYDDVIKSTDIPNLFVLPCGPTPPNPAELLMSKRCQEIMAELGKRFDKVLLDSPPILAVTDAVVLSRLSDGVIVIAQAGKTVRDDAARAAKQLLDVDARVVGVVLNDMDLSDKRYGYGYYYYYGYSDKKSEPGAEPSG